MNEDGPVKYYPAFLDLRGRACVVAGGGSVAERKTLSLVEAGARVTVVAPSLTEKLSTLVHAGTIAHHARAFEDRDIDGAAVVMAATNAREVNARISRLCRERNIPVNTAAPPEESSFIVPSVVQRGRLALAISTGGVSPALAAKLRKELEDRYGMEYAAFLEMLAAARERLLRDTADERVRRSILTALVESDALDLVRQGKEAEAKRLLDDLIRAKTAKA